jgi:hypothetical protein
MTGHLIARDALSPDDRAAMLAILQSNFRHVTPASFAHDLAEKNWVILIRDGAAAVVGFSTLHLYTTTVDGRELAVVFSGDTIIRRDAWGSAALPRTWIHSVWRLHREQCGHLPLYWLLLTGGFRTYRFLSVFWREFYPSCRDTPPPLRRLRDALAAARFGPRFDPAAGVVHLGQPLCDALLPVPAGKQADPDVAFFLDHNPGYVRGDELACVARLAPENLTPAGRRMVRPGAPSPAPQGA